MKEVILFLIVQSGGLTWVDGFYQSYESMEQCRSSSHALRSNSEFQKIIDESGFDSVTYNCQKMQPDDHGNMIAMPYMIWNLKH